LDIQEKFQALGKVLFDAVSISIEYSTIRDKADPFRVVVKFNNGTRYCLRAGSPEEALDIALRSEELIHGRHINFGKTVSVSMAKK